MWQRIYWRRPTAICGKISLTFSCKITLVENISDNLFISLRRKFSSNISVAPLLLSVQSVANPLHIFKGLQNISTVPGTLSASPDYQRRKIYKGLQIFYGEDVYKGMEMCHSKDISKGRELCHRKDISKT